MKIQHEKTVIAFSLIGLVIIALWGNMVLEKSFKLYKKAIQNTIQIFDK